MTRLGVVSRNGAVYFTHVNINQCRAFLNDAGLDCTYKGWENHKYYGAIYFDGGDKKTWTAAYWLKESAVEFKVAR